MQLDILAFGAHPDDVELGCAGTLAKHKALGDKIGIIDLTQGELGTRGTAQTRAEEAANAAQILQADVRENMQFADGFFLNDPEHQMKLIVKIRQYRPRIVLCNAIDDRHIDHAKGSNLVSHACFLSGLAKIQTHWQGAEQAPWRPQFVYHYIQWKNISPDFVVDISGYMQKKVDAVLAYKTQFFDAQSQEPQTPITSLNFLESVTYRAKDLGRLVGVDYAEGFTCERYPAVSDLWQLS